MARYARRPPGSSRPRGPWKHGPIPVIGLIGGIGSGKSLVASRLAGLGAMVLDADAIGHALLDQRPSRDLVVERFGEGVLDRSAPADADAPPKIDRRALGELVFARPGALHELEAILHPRMRKTFERAISRAERRPEAKAIVLDAAVLLEAGWDDLCDTIVFVDAPRDQRLARLSAQRGWGPEVLEARERAQWDLAEKRNHAGQVVVNDGDPEALAEAVDRLWPTLIKPRPRPRPPAPGLLMTPHPPWME